MFFCVEYICYTQANTAPEHPKRSYVHKSRRAGSNRQRGKRAATRLVDESCARAVSIECCKAHSCTKAFSPLEVLTVRRQANIF